MSGANSGHFLGPLQCDSAGRVLYVPAPPPAAQFPSARTPADTAVRISADGKTITRFSVTSAAALGEGAEILQATFDARGDVYVLAAADGAQYVLSFARDGRYRSMTAIDSEVSVASFAVFESGDVLLSGYRPDGQLIIPLVAVHSIGSGSLRDVPLSGDPAGATALSSQSRVALASHVSAAPARDGNMYFARMTPTGPVYTISPSGSVRKQFALAPPKPGATLWSLKAAGDRLAAIYREKAPRSEQGNMVDWIVIYDTASGEQVAAYGPTTRPVLCYRPTEALDQFTLLSMRGQQLEFLEATAP